MATDFDNVRLPVDIERGAVGGPSFRTTVITLANGDEQRNQEWEYSRDKFNIGYGIQRRADMEAVYAFFQARGGRARGFRFRNWLDFQVVGQPVGIVEGVPTQRQLIRPYADVANQTFRIVTHPVAETLKVYVNMVLTTEYELGDNGVLTFPADPGANVRATFDFDLPARFDNDDLNVQLNTYKEGSFPSIQIVELRR